MFYKNDSVLCPLGSHVAILGSAFDPMTLAHLALIFFTLKWASVPDLKVWFTPYEKRPGKNPKASFEHRLQWLIMGQNYLNQRLKDHFGFQEPPVGICLWEVQNTYVGTYGLLEALSKIYPTTSFALIVGEDSFRAIESWDNVLTGEINGPKLLAKYPIYYKTRPPQKSDGIYTYNKLVLQQYAQHLITSYQAKGLYSLPCFTEQYKELKDFFDFLKDFKQPLDFSSVSSSEVRHKLANNDFQDLPVVPDVLASLKNSNVYNP